ncbi:hypothetical protein [Segnochrobactrum spirostomi]|uniref:Uncharacterized protein n=1 Tax=Segnochrobactrum spirostomi TaxID=2608987 RepID=A0A6A7Y4U1_9HYPH|nr:hypothetical protein [Segnochrobactrum spirostomi]MQT14173.1 hypothetical protein [Segnochrobactrum spirostomi]
MSRFNHYLVEIDDNPAGILIRTGSEFAFHAVGAKFAPLEGATFPDAVAAERAARRLARHGGTPKLRAAA